MGHVISIPAALVMGNSYRKTVCKAMGVVLFQENFTYQNSKAIELADLSCEQSSLNAINNLFVRLENSLLCNHATLPKGFLR